MAKRTYTPDEYQSQFVDFYNYGGIDVNVAAAAGEEEKKEEEKVNEWLLLIVK